MANELVARHGLRVSGSTFISTVNTDQSLLSSVLTIDPSNNEVKNLSVATFAADFITGGTLSGTGNKDLVLNQYDGSSVTISDVNIETTGGTYTSSTGTIQFTQNDGSTFDVSGWDYLESASISANDITLTDNLANDTVLNIDAITGATFDLSSGDITWEGSNNFEATLSLGTDFVTGVTESDNVVTITKNGGVSSNFTIDAITGLGYDGDWALSGTSTGVSAPAIELPFITGGTYNAGTITLSINNGVETNIEITGLTNTDTHVTGGTLTQSTGEIELEFNQGYGPVTLDGAFEFVTGGTLTDNGITLETNLGNTDSLGTITALTGLTQTDNDVSFEGSNGATGSISINAVTGGTFDASTGTITVEGTNVITNIELGTDFVTGVTESNNVITVGNAGAGTTDFTIQAVTGITYNDDWDIAFVGTGSLGTTPVDLPFVTGGTYSSGTITLNLNAGAGESDITITGLTNTDTYVTGATVDYTGATLQLNQSAPDVEITSEQTIRVTRTGTGTLFNVSPSNYSAVHVEYSIIDGVNARSGFFTAVFNNSNVEYADFSTVDLGTVDGELSADSSGNVIYTGSGTITANTRAVAI